MCMDLVVFTCPRGGTGLHDGVTHDGLAPQGSAGASASYPQLNPTEQTYSAMILVDNKKTLKRNDEETEEEHVV